MLLAVSGGWPKEGGLCLACLVSLTPVCIFHIHILFIFFICSYGVYNFYILCFTLGIFLLWYKTLLDLYLQTICNHQIDNNFNIRKGGRVDGGVPLASDNQSPTGIKPLAPEHQ